MIVQLKNNQKEKGLHVESLNKFERMRPEEFLHLFECGCVRQVAHFTPPIVGWETVIATTLNVNSK